MHTFSIEFDDKSVAHWEALARANGQLLEELIREAVIDRLEELEDYAVVKERLSKPYETIRHEEVLKRLGLNDAADAD